MTEDNTTEEVIATEYYIDAEGNYLGGFSQGNPSIPVGAIEIPSPPGHGWQKYDMVNGGWLPLTDEQKALVGAE